MTRPLKQTKTAKKGCCKWQNFVNETEPQNAVDMTISSRKRRTKGHNYILTIIDEKANGDLKFRI